MCEIFAYSILWTISIGVSIRMTLRTETIGTNVYTIDVNIDANTAIVLKDGTEIINAPIFVPSGTKGVLVAKGMSSSFKIKDIITKATSKDELVADIEQQILAKLQSTITVEPPKTPEETIFFALQVESTALITTKAQIDALKPKLEAAIAKIEVEWQKYNAQILSHGFTIDYEFNAHQFNLNTIEEKRVSLAWEEVERLKFIASFIEEAQAVLKKVKSLPPEIQAYFQRKDGYYEVVSQGYPITIFFLWSNVSDHFIAKISDLTLSRWEPKIKVAEAIVRAGMPHSFSFIVLERMEGIICNELQKVKNRHKETAEQFAKLPFTV